MHGTFEFFANLYLRNGFQVGFVAAADDHRARPGYAVGLPLVPLAQLSGLAAVLAPEKTPDAIFDAMRGLSAYATSGQRIVLDATLNGSPMGSRQPDADRRELRCRVLGTAPISHIDVIKNGSVVFSRSYLKAPLEDRIQLLVGFESSSEVFPPPRDNPRGFRTWQGTLEVTGARVAGLSTPGFDNRYLDRAAVDPSNPNLIRFHVETRGRRDTMLLELEGASSGTTLSFQIEPSRESGLSGDTIHRLEEFPPASLQLRLDNLVDGLVEHELRHGPHTDRVTAEVIHPEGALDMDLEYTDLEETRSGDYYYVRVTQLDGGRAWSSPFWVGEKP
jgi:hypothetical protein